MPVMPAREVQGDPVTVRCWRCNRALYVVTGEAKGTVTKVCERCKAQSVVNLDTLEVRP